MVIRQHDPNRAHLLFMNTPSLTHWMSMSKDETDALPFAKEAIDEQAGSSGRPPHEYAHPGFILG
jgi:hypothetical protein